MIVIFYLVTKNVYQCTRKIYRLQINFLLNSKSSQKFTNDVLSNNAYLNKSFCKCNFANYYYSNPRKKTRFFFHFPGKSIFPHSTDYKALNNKQNSFYNIFPYILSNITKGTSFFTYFLTYSFSSNSNKTAQKRIKFRQIKTWSVI